MSTLEILMGCLLIISALIISVVVLMQSSKGDGLTSTIMGAGATGGARERGKTTDAKLATVTKWLAAVFFIIALTINAVWTIQKAQKGTEDPTPESSNDAGDNAQSHGIFPLVF